MRKRTTKIIVRGGVAKAATITKPGHFVRVERTKSGQVVCSTILEIGTKNERDYVLHKYGEERRLLRASVSKRIFSL